MKRARVGFDLRWLPTSLAHYMRGLYPAIVEQGRAEFDFVAYGNDGEHLAIGLGGDVEPQVIPWKRYTLREQFFLPARLRRDRIDIFHTPFYVIPVAADAAVIATIHDTIPFSPHGWQRGLKRAGICAMNLAAAHLSSAVLTVSATSKADIVRRLKIHSEKISLAPCGVGEHLRAPSDAAPFAAHAPYFACMTARHWESKDTITAVRAWKIFRAETGLPHKLLIGGDPSRFRDVLAREGVDERCALLGFLEDSQMAPFFGCSEAFVIPSLYEGFGLPALEAMASGAAVISSTAGSLPEIGGDAMLYFEPRDARELADRMISVCRDPELKARLITAGAQRAAQYTYAASASGVLACYRKALQQ